MTLPTARLVLALWHAARPAAMFSKQALAEATRRGLVRALDCNGLCVVVATDHGKSLMGRWM